MIESSLEENGQGCMPFPVSDSKYSKFFDR